MVCEHANELGRAGVRNRRGRAKNRAEDQHVGTVQEHLADLRKTDPARALDQLPRNRPFDRRAANVPGRGKPPSQPQRAAHHDDKLGHHPAGSQRRQTATEKDQRDGDYRTGAPRSQLDLADECEVLHALKDRLVEPKGKRHQESGKNDRQRPLEFRPSCSNAPPRQEARGGREWHLPAHDRIEPRKRHGQLVSPTAHASAGGIRRFTRRQCNHAKVHQRKITEYLCSNEPQAIVVCPEVCQQEGRQP
jgi:hypothetical protein